MKPLGSALLLLFASVALPAQTFEVASIKPNASSDHRVAIQIQPGGRFVATGIPARILIGIAYNIRDFQIINAPGWAFDERFDINAKAESSGDRLSMEQIRPMLKSLLAERFGLKGHEETKEMPVYTLVAGKGGHKLKPSVETAGPQNRMFRMGRGQINAKGVSMAALAQQLAQQLGRPVTDKTGIEGNFDVELNWTPEPGQGSPFGGPPPGASGGPGGPTALPVADSSGPTIYTAVQEQLGLRLESARGPVPVLVIEALQKPTEN